jgi:biopolymer transport protein ExbB
MPSIDQGVFSEVLSRLEALKEAGGVVMLPLLAVGLIAWFAIALRAVTLIEVKAAGRRCFCTPDKNQKSMDRVLRLRVKKSVLYRQGAFVDTLVAAAPLLGLLGTVSGMIETFEGLTASALFTEGGGIAGGIAEALTTTQAGLLIAVPSFFANKVIDRKVRKLDQRICIWEAACPDVPAIKGASAS